MITPTLPGSKYGLYIDKVRADGARLFVSRDDLLDYCQSVMVHSLSAPPIIAEVGVFSGSFSTLLISILKPGKFYLIDTFNSDDHVTGQFKASNHLQFIENKFQSSSAQCLQGISWHMLEKLPNNSIDYMYIDAGHTYEDVKKDIAAAYPKMRDNGIIQFNDYCTYSPFCRTVYGVLNAVNEFIEGTDGVNLVGLSLDTSCGYHDLAVQVHKHNDECTTSPPVTIVTPCTRPENLMKLKESIRFECIDKWYIVYDTRKVPNPTYLFDHPQIVEMICDEEGVVGHQIRNAALDKLCLSGVLYYLDDDNIIHPGFWEVMNDFQKSGRGICVFDLIYPSTSVILPGSTQPKVDKVDNGQYAFNVGVVKNLRFNTTKYNADGIFIEELCKRNENEVIYMNKVGAYYNFLRQ